MNSQWITLWVASGVFIGGVVTPVLASPKRVNDWLAMVLGSVVGAVGNVIGLIPLWGLIVFQPQTNDKRLPWQRDDMSKADLEAALAVADDLPTDEVIGFLKANFWPQPRAEGHSHRHHYVSVFVALAVATFIEVALAVIDPSWVIGPLVMLSTVKVLLVVGFFMHLAYDSKWYAFLFAFAMPFAGLIMIILALAI